MSTVHLVGGEKGGVGKSVVARVMAQYFVDHDVRFVGVDADASHGALLRYYDEYSQAVDLDSFSSTDQIMDRALGAQRRVLVDLPAQSAKRLEAWLTAGDVVTFAKQMDVTLAYWHVTDGGFDSVAELTRCLDAFGDQLRYVIVKNYGRSQSFEQLDESEASQRVRDFGGRVIDLPALDPSVMYRIDRFGSSFWAAINCQDGDWALTPMQRRRAKLWLDKCYAALEQGRDWL